MKNAGMALCGLAAICFGNALSASDWPTFMQNYARVGDTPDQLKLPLAQRWVYSSASPPQRAWPGPGGKVVEGYKLEHRVRFDDVFHVAMVGDVTYFGSSVDNTIYCVETESGKPRWTFTTMAPVRLAPTVVHGRVYVGSDDGFVYCLDASSGSPIWKLRAGPRDERILARGRMTSRWPIRTGVLVDEGVAYFGAGVFPHETVYLYAVDAESGQVIWKNDTISQRGADRDDLTPQGYLLATKDLLFVPSGRTLPAAFDRKTGERLHKQRGGGKQVGGSSALLADEQLYSIGAEQHILALDQQTGSIDNRLRGRQMTLRGNVTYIADGKQIVAIDRVAYARSKQQRLALERKLSDVQRSMLRNPAQIQLRRVRELERKLARAQENLKELRTSNQQGTPNIVAAEELEKAQQDSLAATVADYEASRKDYQSYAKQYDELKKQIEETTKDGIKWRSESPHESVLIVAGSALVAGGMNEVSLLAMETGQALWSQAVDGEVRGLAAANGNLLVSTTSGKIYCFGDAGQQPAASELAHASSPVEPFPHDKLSDLYSAAAEQIISRSGVTNGFCLVYGSEEGRLAYQLAKRTNLVIYCLEADANKVATSRKKLAATGLYGRRITIDHLDLSLDPYPNYFANLIVSDTLLRTGRMPGEPRKVASHLKPEGGVLCLGVPAAAAADVKSLVADGMQAWLRDSQLFSENARVVSQDGWTVLTRGAIPGVAYWTHQYGNPGNTASIEDQRVRGGVRVLWYGDPGPSRMTNRHQGAVGPVSTRGRLFVQGDESVMAYGAYNGQFLWEWKNTGALRTGVYRNHEPGNLVAVDDSLFVVVEDKCLHLDAATGQIVRTYTIPTADTGQSRQWGYIAYLNGRLIGTSTQRKLVAEEARRRGRTSESASTDEIFAIDAQSGEHLWTYHGQSIAHTTIALDEQHVYFIDSSITPEQRERILRQDKSELENLTGKERDIAEQRLKRIDVRRAVALDVESGRQEWAEPVDVTDCTGVGIGAGQLTLMVSDGYVVLCGANANGHYWKQFLAGEFQRRRLVVLAASDGHEIWARDANYRHRPIVVGDRIIAEPWAFYLPTGEQEVRIHPLTGMQTPWKFIRPGHHCGALSATPNMLFFRSGFTAFYNLQDDSGTQHFAGHRLGCWINTIPAGGLVMIPEASAGCACLFSLTSTVVFEPRESRQSWGVYTAEGATTPVQHLALNLGAPGDRRDALGKLWLSYPRPSSRAGLDLPLEIRPMSQFGTNGTYFQKNSESHHVQQTDTPWLYTSGMQGMTRCELPLIGPGQPPAQYTVRLYFAAPAGDKAGQRTFDVKLQGQLVLENLDVVARAGGPQRGLIVEEHGVSVTRDLSIELVPNGGSQADSSQPIICAIEVVRAGADEIIHKVAAQ